MAIGKLFYAIEPQRDLGLIPADLGGWEGLLEKGETKFVKCLDDRAEQFAVLVSNTGLPGDYSLVDDFKTRKEAEDFVNGFIENPNLPKD